MPFPKEEISQLARHLLLWLLHKYSKVNLLHSETTVPRHMKEYVVRTCKRASKASVLTLVVNNIESLWNHGGQEKEGLAFIFRSLGSVQPVALIQYRSTGNRTTWRQCQCNHHNTHHHTIPTILRAGGGDGSAHSDRTNMSTSGTCSIQGTVASVHRASHGLMF